MSQSAVVLDIEGTTTSISFVYDTLFPFAAEAMEAFLSEHADDPAVREAGNLIAADAESDETSLPWRQRVLTVALRQMATDAKATGLKQLQGLIWRYGYESGAVRGHVYDDVPVAFARWRRQGVRIAIYSSGSVLAQQLLFGHSEAGDLRTHIDAYFDTRTGGKRDPTSYTRIASELALPAGDCLFATDRAEEAEAAIAAGMRAKLLDRPGNAPITRAPCPVVTDLLALDA